MIVIRPPGDAIHGISSPFVTMRWCSICSGGAIHPLVLVLLLRYGMYWLARQHRRSYGVDWC